MNVTLARPCARTLTKHYYSTGTPKSLRKVVFSGIQPTGTPHLGNYLGALSNWVKLQRDAAPDDQLLFSIVGWHALTMPQDPKTLSIGRTDMLAALLAIGLNPDRCIIFHQDHNLHHTELAWILNCISSVGKLRRMTTWKSKIATARNAKDESEIDEVSLNDGLFTYPVLQAADILAYRATHVPVGEDQQQHLELSRDLADTFNRTFKGPKPLFPLPQHVITPSRRILSLRDPTSKMSKSAPDVQSRILLTDDFSQIKSKIRSAVTDSQAGVTYDPVNRPGAANLLTILAACTGEAPAEVAKRYAGKGHGDLKADVAEAIEYMLKGPRGEFQKLRGETEYLKKVATEGAQKSIAISETTMREVRSRLGLS